MGEFVIAAMRNYCRLCLSGRCLLAPYQLPGSVLGTGCIAMRQTDISKCTVPSAVRGNEERGKGQGSGEDFDAQDNQ